MELSGISRPLFAQYRQSRAFAARMSWSSPSRCVFNWRLMASSLSALMRYSPHELQPMSNNS
jgi:hypothetical protein